MPTGYRAFRRPDVRAATNPLHVAAGPRWTRGAGGRKLVIVESPAKAKTIAGYLGRDFDVEASVGHIRDLPEPVRRCPPEMKKGPFGQFGVDVDNGFEAYYVVDADKKKKVAELKRLSRTPTSSTRHRRGPRGRGHRLAPARGAQAQGARSSGWCSTRSPRRPSSARSTTPATSTPPSSTPRRPGASSTGSTATRSRRCCGARSGRPVRRPRAVRGDADGRRAGARADGVRPRVLLGRRGRVHPESSPAPRRADAFTARLTAVDGDRVATGRDFADNGELKPRRSSTSTRPSASAIAEAVQAAPVAVTSVQEKPYTRRPAAPFTTSTLQQEASRKLRLSSKNAMRVAQRLYENGYITYMRTDSTTLSESARPPRASQARDLYGAEYVPAEPRGYTRRRSRTPRRPTRPSARRATGSAPRPRWPASCAATSSPSTS